jgi:hypothetical protein
MWSRLNRAVVARTMRKQIEQLVQLNEGQRYTLEGTALIKMEGAALDPSTAEARFRVEEPDTWRQVLWRGST